MSGTGCHMKAPRLVAMITLLITVSLLTMGCDGHEESPAHSAYGYTASGSAISPTGSPIANVLILITGGQTGDQTEIAVTDSSGRWSAVGLEGEYSATAHREGMTFSPPSVLISKDSRTSITFIGSKVHSEEASHDIGSGIEDNEARTDQQRAFDMERVRQEREQFSQWVDGLKQWLRSDDVKRRTADIVNRECDELEALYPDKRGDIQAEREWILRRVDRTHGFTGEGSATYSNPGGIERSRYITSNFADSYLQYLDLTKFDDQEIERSPVLQKEVELVRFVIHVYCYPDMSAHSNLVDRRFGEAVIAHLLGIPLWELRKEIDNMVFRGQRAAGAGRGGMYAAPIMSTIRNREGIEFELEGYITQNHKSVSVMFTKEYLTEVMRRDE